jgi:hypothetical protein
LLSLTIATPIRRIRCTAVSKRVSASVKRLAVATSPRSMSARTLRLSSLSDYARAGAGSSRARVGSVNPAAFGEGSAPYQVGDALALEFSFEHGREIGEGRFFVLVLLPRIIVCAGS